LLLTPAFRERESMRAQAERLAELLSCEHEPRGLADELVFHGSSTSRASRFAQPEGGDEESVKAIGRTDVRVFLRDAATSRRNDTAVVGPISPAAPPRISWWRR
jgi:hypothetical protein